MPLGDDDPAVNYSGATLTPLELERVREIVLEDSVSTIETIASELSSDQRRATRYDIDLWLNKIGEGTLSLHDGSDGVDISKSRDRNAIRRRVALRLGLEMPSLSGGIFQIPVVTGYSNCYED
jgi:hypothetical protein